jgi:DNA-binding IclR family transcriptional regulator
MTARRPARNSGRPTPDSEDGASAGQTAGAQSIRRALRVLRILAAGQEQGVRLTDIVDEARLTRPTVHRILGVLIEEQAVEQDPATRRYMIGQEVSLLGLARTARFPIRAVADPYLRHLSEQVGDTIFLTIRSGVDSICVDRKLGTYPVKVMSIEVGARRPLGVGVGGLALLAFLPEKECAAIIKSNAQRLAQHALSAGKLQERVRATRARGYAYTPVGVMRGTSALSVPVLDKSGEPVAAISVAAIASRMPQQRVAELVSLLGEQARTISMRLAEIGRARRQAP